MTGARTLKIGVLGCGQISQSAHFEATRKAKNAELYAICDLAEDLVAKMQVVHEPQHAFTNYAEMLADPELDAVIIGTADQFHIANALQALDAGKHVLVEKPLGVTIEECETICDRAAETGLTVQVGTMKRFDPGIAFAHRFVQEEIGELLALKAWYCDSTYRYVMTDNLQPIVAKSARARRPAGDPKADRQRYYMLGHGSHLIDTARFLGGEILAVRGRLAEKFGAYCWFVDVEFANGALGQLDLTIAVRMDWHEGFQIYGEHGSVTGKTYNPWYFRSSDVECFSTRNGQYHRVLGEDAHVYKLQVEGFADSILNGTTLRGADAEDGLAAMRGMVAIARSVERGDWVRLDSVAGGV